MIGDPVDMSKMNLVRGMVVNVSDPESLCRVQVRIPSIHGVIGSENYMTDDKIPWAYPSLPANMKPVPKVGDFVWVMFENNQVHMPVYMGTVLGKGTPNPKPVYIGTPPKGGNAIPPTTINNNETNENIESKGTVFESPGGYEFTYSESSVDDYMKVTKGAMSFIMSQESVKSIVGGAFIEVKEDSITLSIGSSSITLTSEGIVINTPRLDENP
jgi:hypothetical protein